MIRSCAATSHPLIRRLRALCLPPVDFVICGSGPLLVCGIRDSIADLDVVARGEAWDRAVRIGTLTSCVGVATGDQAVLLDGGRIEVFQAWPAVNSDELIDGADVIDGVRFANLSHVAAYKRHLGRPKDLADLAAMRLHQGRLAV